MLRMPAMSSDHAGDRRPQALQQNAFGQLVHQALTHLHDLAFLQTHPLNQVISHRSTGRATTSGQALQQRLLDTIERLRPSPETPANDRAWRAYRLLTLCYVEGLDVAKGCERLGVSRRQFFRDHRRGFEAVVSLLSEEAAPLVGSRDDLDTGTADVPSPSSAFATDWRTRMPLVGRREEVAFLKAQYEAAAAGEGGRIILVSGEPGVGKTRLVQELGQYAWERGGVFLEGRYLREGTVPYAPWADALRMGLRGLTQPELAQAVGPYGADLAQALPELADAIGPFRSPPTLGPEERRLRLYDGIARLVVHLSQRRPLVILLDDLHWASGMTLLAHLGQSLGEARILLVGTYRDQEFKEQPTLLSGRDDLLRARQFMSLVLKPLDELETSEMVKHVLGPAVAERLGAAVFRTAGGNAFFVEEVLRSLVDSGAVQASGTGWDVVDPSGVRFPDSLKLAVDGRVARLGEAVRDVLVQAAVLGQTFSFPVLQSMTGLDVDTLTALLERALEARLVLDQSTSTQERFAFADDQISEVLYGGLTSMRRRRLHRRAGEALELVCGDHLDEQIEQLARHFTEGNDPEKGAAYSYQAGRKAEQLYAWAQSVQFYSSAAEIWERLGGHIAQRAGVYERLGLLSFKSGIDMPKALGYLQQALGHYEALGDRIKMAAIHSQIGREQAFGWASGPIEIEQAIDHLHSARMVLQELPESPALGVVYMSLASSHDSLLRVTEAYSWAREVEALGRRLDHPALVAHGRLLQGRHLVLLGQIAEGTKELEQAWQFACEQHLGYQTDFGRSIGVGASVTVKNPRMALAWAARRPDYGSRSARTSLLSSLIVAHTLHGELEAGARAVAELQASLKALNLPYEGRHAAHEGFLLLRKGEWDVARRLLEDVWEEGQRSHHYRLATTVAHWLAESYREVGDYRPAEARVCWALERCENGQANPTRVALLCCACDLYASMGRLPLAEAALEEALAILTCGEDWGGLAGDIHRSEGVVRAAQGRWVEAERAFQRAIDVNQQQALLWDEANVYYAWAQALMASMPTVTQAKEDNEGIVRRHRARQPLARAMRLWEAIGAGPYAERCRRELAVLR